MFGDMIRGYRQQFRYVEKLTNFVRISGDGPFLVELCAPGHLPSGPRGKQKQPTLYRVGWIDKPEVMVVIEALPRTSTRVSYYLDDNGDRIGDSSAKENQTSA